MVRVVQITHVPSISLRKFSGLNRDSIFCFHTIAGLQDVRIEAFQEQNSQGQETLSTIANLGKPLRKRLNFDYKH